MLPGDEEDVAEALGRQVTCLCLHLIQFQCHALDCVFARETTVGAGVYALVGEVKWCKKSHRLAKVPSRYGTGLRRERF